MLKVILISYPQEDVDLAVRKLAARYRSRKEYLRDFTSLHMMVITLRCNQRCGYCQVSSADEESIKYDMPVETAEKIVDFILSAPTDFPKIEFQGGEPTITGPLSSLQWNVQKNGLSNLEKMLNSSYAQI